MFFVNENILFTLNKSDAEKLKELNESSMECKDYLFPSHTIFFIKNQSLKVMS